MLAEKSDIVSFASSNIQSNVLFPFFYRFEVKYICCIALGSLSTICS